AVPDRRRRGERVAAVDDGRAELAEPASPRGHRGLTLLVRLGHPAALVREHVARHRALSFLVDRRQPWIGARIAAARRLDEPREVVLPAVSVRVRRFLARQIAMGEAKCRPAPARDELDLDRARAGRYDVGLPVLAGIPAPGEDESPGRVELDELAAPAVPR